MKKSKILIIDGSHSAHRSFYKMANMSYQGQSTSITWGFLNILGALLGRFKPSRVYVCWDHGSNPKRLELLPTYRQREKRIDFDAEDYHRQLSSLRDMLNYLGIPQLYAPGAEADDYIFELTRRVLTKTSHRVIISSGDKDFRQLVNDRVFINDNNKGLITPLNFKALFGLQPEQYADYLCLVGDDSDKIPGIKGIGDKTAIKILTQHFNVPLFLKNQPMDKFAEPIRKLYPLNRQLINLQYFHEVHGPQKLTYFKGQRKPDKNILEYKKLCTKFGINKFKESEFLNQLP